MIRKPEVAHHLLNVVTDYLVQAALLWFTTFKEYKIVLSQSEPTAANSVISPKQFEQFALPYIKKLHEEALRIGYKHIYCHICGEQNANLPLWSQVPMGDPGIVSVGQQIDLEAASRYFPNDIIFGNLDPTLLQLETPEKVYEATKEVVLKGKRIRGRYVFGMGCEIPARVKKQNLLAVMKAVADFGWCE
jgi:uroporphyrinogen decarboxylase